MDFQENLVRHQNHDEHGSIREAVQKDNPVNPAMQRLQARVLQGSHPGEVITSYDRMHHRHNRS